MIIKTFLLFQTPLFKDLDPGFLRMLSLNIKQALYLPSQIIQRRGDLGKEMFFIMHGEIEVYCIICQYSNGEGILKT